MINGWGDKIYGSRLLSIRINPVNLIILLNPEETYHSELVIMGASRESLLKQAWYGNIPEQIANKLDSTVIIIRLPS